MSNFAAEGAEANFRAEFRLARPAINLWSGVAERTPPRNASRARRGTAGGQESRGSEINTIGIEYRKAGVEFYARTKPAETYLGRARPIQ